jgi:hypothetical protein
MRAIFRSDTLNGRGVQKNLREDGRIILKWVFKKEAMVWIKFAEGRLNGGDFVTAATNFRGSINVEYFFSGRATISVSGRTMLQGVSSPRRYEILETLWKWSWVSTRVSLRPVVWRREGNEHRTGTFLHLVTGREVKARSSKSQQTPCLRERLRSSTLS